MHVAFALARLAHPDELRPTAQLAEAMRSDVTHARLQPTDELIDIRCEGAAIRHSALDALRHDFAVGHVLLHIAVAHALAHRADGAHPAILFVGAALVEHRLARAFLGAREQRPDHHGRGSRGERLDDIAGEAHAAIGDNGYVARLADGDAVHDRRHLRNADARNHA